MKSIFFGTIFILLAFTSCAQKNNHAVNPKARELNDSAIALMRYPDSLSHVKAISLFDQAIAIDSNYILAYYNKFECQKEIRQYSNAIQTGKQIIELRPNIPGNYESLGNICYMDGDSTSGDEYYGDALVLHNKILDTMSVSNKNYNMELLMKGEILMMLERYEQGNQILKQLSEQQINANIEGCIDLLMNKTRKEILYNSMGFNNSNNWIKIK